MSKPRTINRDAVADGERLKAKLKRTTAHRAAQLESRPVRLRNDRRRRIAIEYIAVSLLKRANRRARRTSAAQRARLRLSLVRFDFVSGIVINDRGEVIIGHGLLEAAIELGYESVPCIRLADLDENEQRHLALVYNRLAETGEWDEAELALTLQDLSVSIPDFDPVDAGFDVAIADLLAQSGDTDEDRQRLERLPELVTFVTSALGDVWNMEAGHRIGVADARDGHAYDIIMEGEDARAALSDAPYNVELKSITSNREARDFPMGMGEWSRSEFLAFIVAEFRVLVERTLPGGMIIAYMDHRHVDVIYEAGRALGLEHVNLLVWAKNSAANGSPWRSQHELLVALRKPGGPSVDNIALGKHGRNRSNILFHDGASSLGSEARSLLKLHCTPKPTALAIELIFDVTEPGDICIDNFSGSGSTLIACEKTGRRFRGGDLDPAHVDTAIRRWQELTGKSATLAATGETFAEVTRRRQGDGHDRQRSAAAEPTASPPQSARASDEPAARDAPHDPGGATLPNDFATDLEWGS